MPQLYDFQQEAADLLQNSFSFLVADVAGLGKTAETLAGSIGINSLIIFCPEVVKEHWKHEIKKWRPDIKPRILKGGNKNPWPLQNQATILNYEIIPSRKYPRPDYPVCIIFDEVHRLKNDEAIRYHRANKLLADISASRGDKIFGMTATPILNHPRELFSIMKLLKILKVAFPMPGLFWTSFKRDKETKRWIVADYARNGVSKVMIRRERSDVNHELPSKQYRIYLVSDRIPSKVRKILDRANERLDYYEQIQKIDPTTKLKTDKHVMKARSYLAEYKTKAVINFVEDYEMQDEPIVIFSAHRHPILKLGERDRWSVVCGGVSRKERNMRLKKFIEGENIGFAGTIGSCGTGMDGLQHRACHMGFVDLAWVPQYNEQTEARLFREGQTDSCLFTIFVAKHPIDIRLGKLLHIKEDLFDQIIVSNGV